MIAHNNYKESSEKYRFINFPVKLADSKKYYVEYDELILTACEHLIYNNAYQYS